MKKKLTGIIALVVVFAAVVLLGSSLVVTKENEYTLVRQFGKVQYIVEEPGLSLKIPFVQTTDTLPKEILLYDLPASDVITKDKKTMITDSYVLWKIKDPLKFAQSLNSSLSGAENRINAVVYNAVKNVVSSMSQNDIIIGRSDLDLLISDAIGPSMDSYGIELLTVQIKQLDLPSDNKAAVYERMISERDQIAAEYEADGKAQAQVIRNSTDRDVAITVSNAEAEAADIVADGESQYMQILGAAYNDSSKQEFYAFIRALEAAEKSMVGDNKTLILPANSPLAKIFLGQ